MYYLISTSTTQEIQRNTYESFYQRFRFFHLSKPLLPLMRVTQLCFGLFCISLTAFVQQHEYFCTLLFQYLAYDDDSYFYCNQEYNTRLPTSKIYASEIQIPKVAENTSATFKNNTALLHVCIYIYVCCI